jgi:hypothetical protein
MITGWDNNFASDWYPGGYSSLVGQWLVLYVNGVGFSDSFVYTNKSWQLGNPSTTSHINVEFTRSPLPWYLNSNELCMRVSYNGQPLPVITIFSWAGSYPVGGPVVKTLPPSINGENSVGSTRAFGWYLSDFSNVGSGRAYIDYMGVYAHPL